MPEITRDEFKRAVKRKGFSIRKKYIDKIFNDFDYDRKNVLCYKDFRHALMVNGESSPDYILNRIHLELKSKAVSVSSLFKLEEEEMEELGGDKSKPKKKLERRRKSDNDDMNFKEFTQAINRFKIDIDIVDLETLFVTVDKDGSGLLSKDELIAALKKFDSDKGLNLNSFRKELYKHLTARGVTLKELFDEFDVRRYGKLTLKNFKDMVKVLNFNKPDDGEVKELFNSINLKKNYRLSFRELELAYDTESILSLFPFIKGFEASLVEQLESKNQTILVFMREFDKDGDDKLNEKEFLAMLDSLKIPNLNSESDKKFLFNACNQDKDNTISQFELREFLNGGTIIDVVDYIESIKLSLRQKRYNLREIFEQIDTDEDKKVNFSEFEVLLKEKCRFKELNHLQIDEIFKYLDRNSKDSISKTDFLGVFGDWKPLDPVDFNKRYFEKLSPRQLKFYQRNHNISL